MPHNTAATHAIVLLPSWVYGAAGVPASTKIGTQVARHSATSATSCRC
ncbi:MAG TPA: hypothetical protein VGD29_28125 [Actinoplanes sp.]